MYALITGASGGLGQAFAAHLAAQGHDLVLTGRKQSQLEATADELRARHGVQVEARIADLAERSQRDELVEGLAQQGIEVDLLVNNAGFGTMADFIGIEPDRVNEEIALNCQALAHLSRLLAPAMVSRRQGAIINVASTAAFQPIPTMAVYAASKAFVLSFSQALWEELRPSGVKVVALCPGPTETSFFEVAGETSAMGRRRTPEQVVASCFRALDRGHSTVVDGGLNAAQAMVARLAPTRLALPIARLVVRPANKSQGKKS